VKFTKMHGIGNDYVYVNGFAEQVENPSKVAELVSDRHFGIGGDGLILILPSKTADVRMQMFNADGSEGEMCGNGIRCVAKYAYEHDLAKANPMRVETRRGILPIRLTVDGERVSRCDGGHGGADPQPARRASGCLTCHSVSLRPLLHLDPSYVRAGPTRSCSSRWGIRTRSCSWTMSRRSTWSTKARTPNTIQRSRAE